MIPYLSVTYHLGCITRRVLMLRQHTISPFLWITVNRSILMLLALSHGYEERFIFRGTSSMWFCMLTSFGCSLSEELHPRDALVIP